MPKLLNITHRVPFPPDKGDRIRNYHVLKQLATIADVSLIALADEPVPQSTLDKLSTLCQRVEIVPVDRFSQLRRAGTSALFGGSLTSGAFGHPKVRQTINQWNSAEPFDAGIVSAAGLAPYLRLPTMRNKPGFVDVVDVDSQKWFDFAEASRPPKRWLYQLEGRRLRQLEAELPDWAAGISLVSLAEAELYNRTVQRNAAMAVLNGVDLDYYQPNPDLTQEQACVFVGALDYLPNIDAACWFAHKVWPKVHAEFPLAEFRVVGRRPTTEVTALAQLPGVKVVGQVPDVRPSVASAMVAVVPIRISRGLQNKVLEAMAMGKPVIAAPPAIVALQTEPGTHLLSATTPEEWHAAIRTLFQSEARRRELSQAARAYVEEHHHWDRCLQPLTDAIAKAMAKPTVGATS